MKLQEISKPNTVEALNENLSKKFGQTIKVDAFTLEQLQDARNKIRTKLSQFETNESYDSVLKDSNYQKNKLFLDVLNTAIAERGEIDEKEDQDNDGDNDFDDVKIARMMASGMSKPEAIAKVKGKNKKANEGDGIYHDCAKSFKHPKLGECKCIPGQHTLLEDGTVTHYDVKVVKNGKRYIVRNVPIAEATDIVSEGHKHASKKTKSRKMKEGEIPPQFKKNVEKMKAKSKGKKDDKKVDEKITTGTGKKGLEKSLDKLYGPKKGSKKTMKIKKTHRIMMIKVALKFLCLSSLPYKIDSISPKKAWKHPWNTSKRESCLLCTCLLKKVIQDFCSSLRTYLSAMWSGSFNSRWILAVQRRITPRRLSKPQRRHDWKLWLSLPLPWNSSARKTPYV